MVDSSRLHDASREGLLLCSILRSSPDLVPNALYTNACFFLGTVCIYQRHPSTFITPSVFTQMMSSGHIYIEDIEFFRSSPFYNGWLKVSYQCW